MLYDGAQTGGGVALPSATALRSTEARPYAGAGVERVVEAGWVRDGRLDEDPQAPPQALAAAAVLILAVAAGIGAAAVKATSAPST